MARAHFSDAKNVAGSWKLARDGAQNRYLFGLKTL
jgi:hypothetical protein